MYLLDTDVTSHILDTRRTNAVLAARLRTIPMDDIVISAITVEEMMKGCLALIRHVQTRRLDEVGAYEDLVRVYNQLRRFPVVPFSVRASSVFNELPSSLRRSGANDCRIAAIAIANNCTLVTANTGTLRKSPVSSLRIGRNNNSRLAKVNFNPARSWPIHQLELYHDSTD